MTAFATNIAAAGASPIYLVEFQGEALYAYDTASGWSSTGDGGSVTANTSTAKEGTGSLSFAKSGTSTTTGGAEATALTAMNLTNYAYLTAWLYVSDLTDVASVNVYAGQDASNRYQWSVDDSLLAAGWNFLRLPFEDIGSNAPTYSTTGSPTRTGVVYLSHEIVMDASGDTLTGILMDDLRGCPYRYSTAKITSPRAPTKFGWLLTPDIGMVRTRVQDGTASIGAARLRVVDDDGTTLIRDVAELIPPGRQASLWMGFRGEIESDTTYNRIYRGLAQRPKHYGRAWILQLVDLLSVFDVPFAQDATEASPLTITGNVVNVLLQLMLSTGNGNNVGDGAGNYDTLSAGNGAGISAELVAVSDIETARDESVTDTVSFTFQEPQESLKAWAFEQVFRAHGIVPIIDVGGQFSINVARPPFGSDGNSITRANTSATGIPSFEIDRADVVNQVLVRHSWNTSTEEFDSVDADNTYQDADSITRHGVRQMLIESRGIITDTIARRAANRILARLANGAPPLELDAFRSQQQRDMGEVVSVTIERTVPDLTTYAYGVSGSLAEVIGRQYNPATGTTKLVLSLTTYRAGNYRRIHPAGAADYDSQTQAAKDAYASIADTSGLLGSANDPAHEIGPG